MTTKWYSLGIFQACKAGESYSILHNRPIYAVAGQSAAELIKLVTLMERVY